MYVVFGANGNTGNVVANTLIDRGERVRVLPLPAHGAVGELPTGTSRRSATGRTASTPRASRSAPTWIDSTSFGAYPRGAEQRLLADVVGRFRAPTRRACETSSSASSCTAGSTRADFERTGTLRRTDLPPIGHTSPRPAPKDAASTPTEPFAGVRRPCALRVRARCGHRPTRGVPPVPRPCLAEPAGAWTWPPRRAPW